MREDVLRELELAYEQQRMENERTEQQHRDRIASEFPAIAELAAQREGLIRETLRGILQGTDKPDSLPERMAALSARIREALRSSGLPEDYLAPVYRCALCRDTGYVGEPVKEPCACLKKAYLRKIRQRIGLQENQRETFESFNAELFSSVPDPETGLSQREMALTARKVCENFANRWPAGKVRDIILTGKSGLGKTFLLRAIAARLLERDVSVLLISAYEFTRLARKETFGEDGALEELLTADVLLLDDLGSEPLMQNITVEQLFRVVNERQSRNLATVFSTNLNLNEFKNRYTERILSRMSDTRTAAVLFLIGEDIRGGQG